MTFRTRLTGKHLSAEQLAAIVSGELGPFRHLLARHHLRSCWVCASRLDAMRHATADLVAYSRALAAPPSGSVRERLRLALLRQESASTRNPIPAHRQGWNLVYVGLAAAMSLMAAAAWMGVHSRVLAPDGHALLHAAASRDRTASAAWHRVVSVTRERLDGGGSETCSVEQWSLDGTAHTALYSAAHLRLGLVRAGEGRVASASPVTHAAKTQQGVVPPRWLPPSARASDEMAASDLWTLLPRAATFAELVGDATLAVEPSDDDTSLVVHARELVSASGYSSGLRPRIVAASLELRKSDLYPLGQRLTVQGERGERTRYTFREVSLGRVSDGEALARLRSDEAAPASADEVAAALPGVPELAGTALSLAVFDALDRAQLSTNYDLRVDEGAGGTVFIEGALPASEAPNLEAALGSLRKDRSLRVEPTLLPEASRRRRGASSVLLLESSAGEGLRTAWEEESGISGRAAQAAAVDLGNDLLETSATAAVHMEALLRLSRLADAERVAALPAQQRQHYAELLGRHLPPLRASLRHLQMSLAEAFPHTVAAAREENGREDAAGSVREAAEAVKQVDQAIEQSVAAPPSQAELPVRDPKVLLALDRAGLWAESLHAASLPTK